MGPDGWLTGRRSDGYNCPLSFLQRGVQVFSCGFAYYRPMLIYGASRSFDSVDDSRVLLHLFVCPFLLSSPSYATGCLVSPRIGLGDVLGLDLSEK